MHFSHMHTHIHTHQIKSIQCCKSLWNLDVVKDYSKNYFPTNQVAAGCVSRFSSGWRSGTLPPPPHLVRSPLLLGLHLGQEATAHHLQARVPPASLRAPPAVRTLPGFVDGVGRPQLLGAVGAAAVVGGLRAAGGVPAKTKRKENQSCVQHRPLLPLYSHYMGAMPFCCGV